MNYPDGTIFFRPDRNKWIAVLDGRQIAARGTSEACRNFLKKRFAGNIVVLHSDPCKTSSACVIESSAADDIHSWIVLETKKVIAYANTKFGLSLNPVIKYCTGTSAGWARGISELKFNTILAQENRSIFHETIKHEVAHLVVNAMYNYNNNRFVRTVKSHGKEFMNTVRELGGNPSRYHNMDLTNSRVRTTKIYQAHCPCQVHMVTKKTMEKLAFYVCKKCKCVLKSSKEQCLVTSQILLASMVNY